MMKLVTFLAALGLAVALPQQQQPRNANQDIPILRSDSVHNEDGTYSYAYETGNGIFVQEKGSQKPAPQGSEFPTITVVEGQYKYTAPEGTPVDIAYRADENGFQAQGAALPTPPPIPPEILRSVELQLANAANQKRAAGTARF